MNRLLTFVLLSLLVLSCSSSRQDIERAVALSAIVAGSALGAGCAVTKPNDPSRRQAFSHDACSVTGAAVAISGGVLLDSNIGEQP